MYAIIEGDLVVGISQNKTFANCIPIPDDMVIDDFDKFRYDGNEIIDVSNVTTFYIDSEGNKHIIQSDTSWQELQCKWDDILKQDENGIWQVVTLDETKSQRYTDVYNLRKEKEEQGIYVDGMYVDITEKGRLNMLSTLSAYQQGLLPQDQPVKWKTGHGEFVEITYDQLKQISQFVAYYLEKLFEIEHYHDDEISKLTTVEDVLNYDITTNWPSNQFTLSSTESGGTT